MDIIEFLKNTNQYNKYIEIKNMDSLSKLSVYMNYFVDVRCFVESKTDITTTDNVLGGLPYTHGRGKPDFSGKYFAEWKLQKGLIPVSFDEYINDDFIDIKDMGKDWDKNGWAQRFFITIKKNSIYNALGIII